MKNSFMVAAILVWAAACQRAAVPVTSPAPTKEIKNESGQWILAGLASPSAMQLPNYKEWYDRSFNSYTVDAVSAQQLKPLLKNKTMEIFLGTWCGDSKREVPRMLKILQQAGMDTTRVALVFVDNSTASYKQSPQHEEKGKNIHHVPTFILYEGKKELGRIIESPVLSLEKDMLSILEHKPYQPHYTAIAYWGTGVVNTGGAMTDGELQTLVPVFRPLAKHSGEFNAYGYMQLAAGNHQEALNVFRLNTLLYPDNANTFDSLGEAWMVVGNKKEAILAYEKALVLKPGDERLKNMIARIKL